MGKGVNLLIPTSQYNKYIHILTDTIGLGQFSESQDVCLLDVTHYENYRVSKIYMRFQYQNSIARGVIVEDDVTRQLYRF